jgi:hypothetical protein
MCQSCIRRYTYLYQVFASNFGLQKENEELPYKMRHEEYIRLGCTAVHFGEMAFSELHVATIQKTVLFEVAAVRTSDSVYNLFAEKCNLYY